MDKNWYKLIFTYSDGDTVKIEYSAVNEEMAISLADTFNHRMHLHPKPILYNGGPMTIVKATANNMEQPTPLTDAQRFNDLSENGNPIHVLNIIKDECDRLQFALRYNGGANRLTESESLNLLRAARHLYTTLMPTIRRIREAEKVKK